MVSKAFGLGRLGDSDSTLFVDSANNRVGVGTSTPNTTLDVVGNATLLGMVNIDNGLLYIDATNNRIGISNTSPSEQLHMTGNLRIGSAVAQTPSGSAPLAFCRAWVNFNGTGTVAIRSSYNVTSITDHNTGDYTVNFTTAMPDVNYQYSGTGRRNNATHRPIVISQASTSTYDSGTSSFRFLTWVEAAAAVEDPLSFNVTVFR